MHICAIGIHGIVHMHEGFLSGRSFQHILWIPFSCISLSPQVPRQSCLAMSLWLFPRQEENTYYEPKLQKMQQSGF